LGQAFQIRDDILGVFGDPVLTGKPADSDLREGKETVLVAKARDRATPDDAALLDRLLGAPDLDEHGVTELRRVLVQSGALAAAPGARTTDYLDLVPLDPAYRACFADGSEIRVRAGVSAMATEVEAVCGRTEALGYERLARWLTHLYKEEWPHFIDRDFDGLVD